MLLRHAKRSRSGALVLAALTFGPLSTDLSAQTFDVKQLDVKQGNLELGLDNTVHGGLSEPGLNRSAHDQSFDYGLRAWWRLSGVLKIENVDDANLRVAKLAVENIFVLKSLDDKRLSDLGFGWFTSVEASVNSEVSNSLIFGPIVTLTYGKFSFTANPFLEQTFGRNRVDGIALNYAWQAKYEVRPGFAFGAEGFGLVENLSDTSSVSGQEHRIGPAIFTEFDLGNGLKVSPDIALLFGLTQATPDIALKLNVGVPLSQRR